MKFLRNYLNNVKPSFIGEGKYSKWFPLFDAFENLFFSYGKQTKNPIHVRDAVDIQKIMVTAQVVDLLPFTEDLTESNNEQIGSHIFEPDQIDLVLDFAPKFVLTIIYGAILDSLASEHAARMVAMQNATDNALEIVDDLTLDLNKARQETITSELLDLVGGMSAIEEN